MKINDVEIEDTYAEAFPMYFGRVLITGVTQRWALTSARSATGGVGGASLIEASIECEVGSSDSPDERPGYVIMVGRPKRKELNHELIARIRNGVVPVPTTATFNAMPEDLTDYFIEIKNTPIQLFGDGYEEIVDVYGRTMYKIPRMDGFYYIDTKFGVKKGVAGGNFLIMGRSQATTLIAAEVAVQAIRETSYVFIMRPAASGSKVSGKIYRDAGSTTNERYCACIADKIEDSKIPSDVRCVYEMIVDGLSMDSVKKAMSAGIKAATTVQGIKKITALNFGGTLGGLKINLYDIL